MMNVDESKQLTDIVEGALEKKDSIKEAIQTLHPNKEESVSIKKIDRLGILTDIQIDAIAVLEWQDKALGMSIKDFSSRSITEGFTDKVKALTVSKEGIGRTEIPNIMKPAVMGEMLQQGLMPMMSHGQGQNPIKRGFFSRMFGVR